MDDRGYWHNFPSSQIEAHIDELTGGKASPPRRFVFSLDLNEIVIVTADDGRFWGYHFRSAEKNKVTLEPAIATDAAGPPYLEFGSAVEIERKGGQRIKAQVWDNRNGKLILRTLPI